MNKTSEERLLRVYKPNNYFLVEEVSNTTFRYVIKNTNLANILIGGWCSFEDKIVRIITRLNYKPNETYKEGELINISFDYISLKFEPIMNPKYNYVIIRYQSTLNYGSSKIVGPKYYIYTQNMNDYKYLNVNDIVCTRSIKADGDIELGIAIVTKVCNNITTEDLQIMRPFCGELTKMEV